MQLEGFILFLCFLVFFPMMILFTDHNVFFVVVSLVLVILSVKKIYVLFGYSSKADAQVISEEMEYAEDVYGVDLRKIDLGFLLARQLFVILFAVYCYWFIHILWQKAITLFVVIHAVRTIVIGFMDFNSPDEDSLETNLIDKFFEFTSSVAVIVLIVFVAINR